MHKKRLLIFSAASFFLLILAILVFLLCPWKPSFARLKGGKEFNFILVTVDTLRADRIGCYGFQWIDTPFIDLFASQGIKFTRCISQTPLTLPSHTSLLTGALPLFHGVRDNGGFIVPPEIKTMAEVFKENGYETAAFVGAYVLDSKWGLNQGFDYYFDQFDLSRFEKISLGTVQRPGNEVMDEALAWLEKKKQKKFFAWIHLYDPHTPYEPPPPFDKKYRHPYLGEIAFTDSQLGRLWEFLKTNDLIHNSFLIFASDHGESLGQHRESTHGFFVYQEAVHVPLIFVTPFENLQGISSSQVVSLVDVMPTVLEMAGFSIPAQVQGASLLPLFFEPGKKRHRFAYSETFYPRFHYGWSELQTLQNDRYKLIIAPELELYDLTQDPNEQRNLASSEKKILAELHAEASKYIKKFSQDAYELNYKKIDEETRQRLAALGYIGSFIASAKLKGKKLANPKEKIVVFNELCKARELGLSGKAEEAIRIIKEIISSDPEVTDAYFSLGNIYYKQGNFKEAISCFEKALERKPDDTFVVLNIALCYQRMREFDEAEKFVLDYLQKGFEDSQLYFMLGGMKFLQKKYDEAIPYYEKCLSVNSESASAQNGLAAIYIIKEDLVLAEKHINLALALNPKLSNVYFNLAQIREKQGKTLEAMEAYRKELQFSPKHFRACFNLSRLYRLSGQEEEELEYLKKTMEINPNFPLSYFYLARIYLNRGQNIEEAISLVKKGIDLKPEKDELPLGYFLLADLYNRLGNEVLSSEYARKGKELAQANSVSH
jgi:arylsulfatase A-like enzyme/predicted Zn-dependent protease